MGRNTLGGKKHKKAKNKVVETKRHLVEKENDTESYAKIIKMLGSGRASCICYDFDQKKNEFNPKERIGVIRGTMRKRVWISSDDYVLVSLRTGMNDDKCDIVWKYDNDEVKELISKKSIPNDVKNDSINFFQEESNSDEKYDKVINSESNSDTESNSDLDNL